MNTKLSLVQFATQANWPVRCSLRRLRLSLPRASPDGLPPDRYWATRNFGAAFMFEAMH
jgi:hypothetical protein